MWLYVTHIQHSQSTHIGVYAQKNSEASRHLPCICIWRWICEIKIRVYVTTYGCSMIDAGDHIHGFLLTLK